ncbi:putative Zinc finger, HIT-type [Helianthus debilis subsp. tardiflorus]
MEPPQPSSPSSKHCDECKTNEFKYKCPGCSVRSCSLPCVKAHKQRTGCTGKRQQLTEFVPLSKFDDNLLLSDYNMLEDVKRIADSAKRRRVSLCGSDYGIPLHLKNLINGARSRRFKLFFLPTGMSKRQTNKTSYNNRWKVFYWTIEWRFHSTDIKLIDHGVNENSNLCSVIQKHLKPGPTNHPLKPFYLEPVESLKFYISKYPKNPRSPVRELDINAPIRKQLDNLVIIEYPVIHVFLPSHSPDVQVQKPIVSQQVQPKTDPVNDSQPDVDPKGLFFKEEEIKDHDSAEPHVLDLTDKSNSKTETKDERANVIDKSPVNDSQPDIDPKGVSIKEEEIKDRDSAEPHVSDLTDKSNRKTETKDEGGNVIDKSPVNDSQPDVDPKGVFIKEEEIKDRDSAEPHVLDLMDKSNRKTETKDEGGNVIDKSPVNDSQPDVDPKGVFFKEEEIKDHDSAEPHVLDLTDKSNSKTETKDEGANVIDKTDPVNDSQPDVDPKGVFFKEEEIKDHDSAEPHVLGLTDKSNRKTETKDEGANAIDKSPVNDSRPDVDPKGVFFKEKEIKDHDSTEPHVLNLTDKSNSKTETKDEGANVIDKSLDSTCDDNVLSDLMNFDFEPELVDVYSSLISETNPDDFLDFDGLCDDLPSKEDSKLGGIEEELEEGEIADSD